VLIYIALIYAVSLIVIFATCLVSPGIGLPNVWDVKSRVLRAAYAWAMLLVTTPLYVVAAIFAIVWFSIAAAAREARESVVDLCLGRGDLGDLGRALLGREAR